MEGFDYIQAIGAELQKADQLAAEMSERIGIFTVKTANRTIREAALRPNPDALWLTPVSYTHLTLPTKRIV